VKNWFEAKGFGFAKPDDGSSDVFVHVRSVRGDVEALDPGDLIEFDVAPGRDGRPAAANVRILGR